MIRALPVALLLLLAVPSSAQDAGPIEVRIEVARTVVHPGETGEIVAVVTVRESADAPFLLTPTSDGPAVVMVRGRLLRADAEDPRTRPLRFHVPFVARTPGDAVLRVRIDGWDCPEVEGEPTRCRAVETEAAVTMTVRS